LSAIGITGLKQPWGVAVDSGGNVYVTDSNRVLKLPVGSSTPVELPFTGLNFLHQVAVDTAGNVYVTDTDYSHSYSRVLKLPAR
jgi:DNA-binding beta-propeller fold protein YncE